MGIPTAVDRLVQQAILQVLEPLFDPMFSDSSFGFRPHRSAHDALLQASKYVEEGYSIVVDCDVEKFFDRVNHDILMGRLARHMADKRLLRIIRRFLQAGLMQEGICVERYEGTPQGGPLSPLLANILLDDLDKELDTKETSVCAPEAMQTDENNSGISPGIRSERGLSMEISTLRKGMVAAG